MADSFDIFTSGVPNVSGHSAPSVIGTGVSIPQAQKLTNDRINSTSQLLEFRDRVATFQSREKSRVEGAAALQELTGLDPQNDPDYQVKVADVLSRNPNASLDASVANFLKVQGNIYNDAEGDRDAVDEATRRDREAKRNFKIRRKQSRVIAEDSIEFKREQELTDTINNLSPEEGDRFDAHKKQGLSDIRAVKKTLQDSQTAAEINKLREAGITDLEIFGGGEDSELFPGLLNEHGRVDPAKAANVVRESKLNFARKEQQKAVRLEQKDTLDRLIDAQEVLDDREKDLKESYAKTDEERAEVAEGVAAIERERARIGTRIGTLRDELKILPLEGSSTTSEPVGTPTTPTTPESPKVNSLLSRGSR